MNRDQIMKKYCHFTTEECCSSYIEINFGKRSGVSCDKIHFKHDHTIYSCGGFGTIHDGMDKKLGYCPLSHTLMERSEVLRYLKGESIKIIN